MLQKITTTAPNRYPGIFRTARADVARRLGPGLGEGRLRILSFGCSTATEVLTLRAYFPDAMIFGCDVDSAALRVAIKETREDACKLFVSSPEAISANGPYDLIFAMSVFCQYPGSKNVSNLESLYPFSLFESLACNLVENVADSGLLCIMNCNYLVRDLPGMDRFNFVRSPLIRGSGFIDRFAKNGRRLTTSFGNRSCYSHRQESEGINDDDLLDCIFKKCPAGEKAGEILTVDDFLRMEAPAGLRQLRILPEVGEPLDKAIGERRVAMARSNEVHVAENGESGHWLRQEWAKSTLDGKIMKFGAWWLPVSPEAAGDLSAAQSAQSAELSNYVAKPRTLGGRLKQLLKR